jgi:BASS family bile acid:Na+ symporter
MLKKILSFYTKFFAVWVVVFGVIAYFLPGPFLVLEPFNEWFFSLTMFGIGAVLSIDDFKRIAEKPVIVLIGSASQFTIMPVGAFVLSRAFGLPDELAVGLILAGCVPGAMASNVMSYIAKADTAYSVSLTTVSTLLCPLLTPGLTKLLAGEAMDVSFWAMFFSVIKMVIIPLGAGFLVRGVLKNKIEKITIIFPAISATFIIFICSLVIAINRDYLGMVTASILVMAVLLNIYGMAAGFSVGSIFNMNTSRRRTLSIEIGMQNAGLSTVLALKHFGERSAIPTAVFVFVCIITASIMAEFWRRKASQECAFKK